jgi:hypothetical protein
MSNDLVNAAAFKGLAPAAAFKMLDPTSESLADGIGSSYGIVGYKGKVWSLRLRGETYMFTRADDGSPAAFLDVIILRAPPYKSKSFYPPGTFQDGQIGTRPTCAALDGVNPDADILTPQAPACATCPRNVFKLNAEGKKTRECSDYKRLSVLILPSMTKALLGAPLMEPVFLRVPAASLNDLAMLGEAMSAQGFHYSTYVTRIGFNIEKPHPQMTFRALQALTDKEAPIVLPMREDPTAIRITGEGEVGRPRAAIAATTAATTAELQQPVDAAQAAQAAAAEAARVAAVQEAARQAQARAEAVAAQKAAAEAAAKKAADDAAARAAVAAQATAGAVETGFGDLGAAPSTPNVAPVTAAVNSPAATGLVGGQTTTVANTVSDTGAPEEADASLDARVAALLPK